MEQRGALGGHQATGKLVTRGSKTRKIENVERWKLSPVSWRPGSTTPLPYQRGGVFAVSGKRGERRGRVRGEP